MPSITLTVTAQQAQRIATAFGETYGLVDATGAPRDATAQEIHDYIVGYIKGIVQGADLRAAQQTIQVADLGAVT